MSHIDTLKAYEDLVESGLTEKQAKAQVRTLDNSLDELATKEYLNKEFSIFRSDMRADISGLKGDISFMIILPIFIGFVVQFLLKKKGWI
jgi:hypothetical protein